MIRVALVRGKYLNNYEGQNYIFDPKKIKLTAISSLKPLDNQYPFPLIKLPSLADLQDVWLFNKPIKYLTNRIIGDAQILFSLEKYADKFDIFHTADPHYYYSYQLAKLRQQGKIKNLISTSWETIAFNNESVSKKKYIKKFTQKYIDLFICYTNRAKDCLVAEGVDERKIKIIRLGVDLNKFKSQKYKPKIKSITILFVGRLVWEKGLSDLQKAVLKINNPFVNLKIVESGKVDYRLMPKIYKNADIFVLPSKTTKTWEEQYGMVLVEAMASGLPIVAYNSGAISEIIADAGLLVSEGNIGQLSTTINRLIEDRNLRLKLGKMGKERVEKYFDSRKTAKVLENIYLL